jgi:hypothetical protein
MEPLAMTLVVTASEPSPLAARAHAIKNCVSVILGLASTSGTSIRSHGRASRSSWTQAEN